MTLNVFLVDDDPIFLNTIHRALTDHLSACPYSCNIRPFSSGQALLDALDVPVDLLIADIDLGREPISGLDVARQYRNLHPEGRIIFLTSFLEYATDIYESQPMYFILKSEYLRRIPQAMDLFFRSLEADMATVTLTSGREQVALRVRDLIYGERVGRKTRLVCTDRELLVTPNLTSLMELLPQSQFFILHQGFLVNLSYIKSFLRYEALLKTGQIIPISRARYDGLSAAFGRFLLE